MKYILQTIKQDGLQLDNSNDNDEMKSGDEPNDSDESNY